MGTVWLKSCPVSLLFLDITVVQVPVVMSGFLRKYAAKVSPLSSRFHGPQLALYLSESRIRGSAREICEVNRVVFFLSSLMSCSRHSNCCAFCSGPLT